LLDEGYVDVIVLVSKIYASLEIKSKSKVTPPQRNTLRVSSQIANIKL
jgi:hypothetical protein